MFLRTLFLSVLVFASFSIAAEPENLDVLKLQLEHYHSSGTYLQEIDSTILKARSFLLQQVELNAKNKKPKHLALVLDIDETALSNYKNIHARQFIFNEKIVDKEQVQADAPAIEATKSLYQLALKKGVSVFFVTGRKQRLKEATEKNLTVQGYQKWKKIFFKPNHYRYKSIVMHKQHSRETIEKMGYTIVASIGDQQSDITGGHCLKGFKLPNPFYFIQ